MYLKLIFFSLIFGVSYSENWQYTFISIDYDIKVDYVKADVTMKRLSKADYAISGDFSLDKELNGDYKFSGQIYRSPRGNDDYKRMPFAMKKQNFYKFFNGLYKDVFMEDLTKCSNLPKIDGQWIGPFEAGTYSLNMCTISVDNWPNIMLPGFYKLVAQFFDDKDFHIVTCTITLQIESFSGK